MDGAHMKQCGRLNPTRLLLSGQVERLARVLPSLVEASSEEIHHTGLRRVYGLTNQRTCLECGSERLLQEREALGEASRAPVGFTQSPSDSR
jgi:hypothetical protein